MSLRETLDAAKREAQEGGSLIFGKDAKDAEAEEATATRSNKRSAANAKPTRERAANVRVVSSEDAKNGATGKKESEMSKEERKAARQKQRAKEDLAASVRNILLDADPAYKRTQHVWWVMLGVGFAMTLATFGINYALNNMESPDPSSPLVSIAMIAIVVAYVCVFGAFIYDWRKGRPIRKEVDARVDGMTRKKMEQIVREDAERKAAEREAKKK